MSGFASKPFTEVETLVGLSGVTELGYDENDFLTSVEAPNGATTEYVYDDFGDLLSVHEPGHGHDDDEAGNLGLTRSLDSSVS